MTPERNANGETQPLGEAKTTSFERLGPYQVTNQIGAGGMGLVFRGVDTRLGRAVAIKTSQEKFSDRFQREARAISSINHPHICTLYDLGTDLSGTSYLVMELVEGETLAARLKKGQLSLDETLLYGAQIADALAAAHAQGIVHRDLKPSNIMVTSFGTTGLGIKVLDFGLAKLDRDATLTMPGVMMGTPAYMAPEQVEGLEAGPATDLFALGLILYEMTAGRLPIPGESLGGVDVPSGLDNLITRLLDRDPAKRGSAAEVGAQLSAMAKRRASVPISPVEFWRRPAVLIPIALATLLAILGGGWLYERFQRQRWAVDVALPEIARLREEGSPLSAFRLLQQVESTLPADPRVVEVSRTLTRVVSVTSSTPGVTVEIQDYLAPNSSWYSLGTTPIDHVRIPGGYFRWRVFKAGAGEFVSAPLTTDSMIFPFGSDTSTQTDSVFVPGGPWGNMIGFIGWVGFQLPPFDMDKFEVTNREYQKFVDEGGYRKREYWKERFLKEGRELTWEQAMDLFRDPTGRPGPSTWEGGHFAEGQADYPVSGVSWYEASAFAVFAGKSLPVLGQWYKAAPSEVARFTANQSNFSGNVSAVGKSQAVGPFGTYDLTGNVREWCLNAVDGGKRFILGGAWGTQTYQSYEPEALPPFDRSPMNGFRSVRNREAMPAASAAPIERKVRDFSNVKPASDEVFQVYRSLYAYDKRALNPDANSTVEKTPDWTKEKVTIDAGYGNERLPLYLFLPRNVSPPYQTVVFFPSARVNFMKSSANLGDLDFVDYVIKSGRALAYPIYRETYQRHTPETAPPGAINDRELTIQESKEVRRTVDYLETRSDIDKAKLAYLGVSQGSAYGLIFTALEDRFKAVVFLDGGFFLGPVVEGRDQADFAPRLKKPVLMVNGKFDFTFPPDQSQAPMFAMIGTPEPDKTRRVFDTPHDVTLAKPALSKEVLAFLDKYLGRVN